MGCRMALDFDVMRSIPRLSILGSLLSMAVLVTPSDLTAQAVDESSSPLAQVADTSFRHDLHTDFGCLDCHAMQADHGALLVADVSDCRSCHHVRERDRGCAACHQEGELDDVVYPRDVTFDLSVRDEPQERDVAFSHEPHEETECVQCHVGDDPVLSPVDLDCGSCHEEHHVATLSGCMECHVDPGADVHTLDVHETCSGSGCHLDPPFEVSPPTRTGCLWCHEDMTDHEPDGQCVDCHLPVGGTNRWESATGPGPLAEISHRRYLHVPH